jgi:hypothetical protein
MSVEKKKKLFDLTKRQWGMVAVFTAVGWGIILAIGSHQEARKFQFAEGTIERRIEANVLKPKWKLLDLQATEQVDGGLGISLNVQLEDPPFMAKTAVLLDLQKMLKGFQALGAQERIDVIYIRPHLTLQKIDGNAEVGRVATLTMKYIDFKDANFDNMTTEQFVQSRGELRLHNALAK